MKTTKIWFFIILLLIPAIAAAEPNPPVFNAIITPTNNPKPTWTWTSGGNGGIGTYRYKLDSSDLPTGATETTATSYTPASNLTENSHILYVQERDASGNWSNSGSASIVIDTAGPTAGVVTNIVAGGANYPFKTATYTIIELVTLVQATQRPGTKLVDITYDLTSSVGDSFNVSVQVSDDGGVTYRVPAFHFSGDGYGAGVQPGIGKKIVWDAGADWNNQYSQSISFRVTASEDPFGIPAHMALIPIGSFQMGDNFSEGGSDERPVHDVAVSNFYMDKYETTKSIWDQVYTWATAHGYTFDNVGGGTSANHPIYNVSWYDVTKWLNARSEMEGRTPVYYTDQSQATPYRTGQINITTNSVKWSTNGYRLPTEAEWEKACRGGLTGNHYPWPSSGGTYTQWINTSMANYSASGTRPAGYYNGQQTPAGVDMANGFGLYDMAGNAWEWTWDWYGAYSSATATNPKGPDTGSGRALRSGSWWRSSSDLRCANRESIGPSPSWGIGDLGFRSALSFIGSISTANDLTVVDTRGFTMTVTKNGSGSGTIVSNPTGISCGVDCSETYAGLPSVTLTANLDTNSIFAGWSGGGCQGTGTCTVTLNSDTTIMATFRSLIIPEAQAVSWIAGDGNWNDAANWSTGALPGPNDDVVIDRPGAVITVTHSSGSITVKSIKSEEIIVISGGSLTVNGTSEINNTFTASNCTLIANGPQASLIARGTTALVAVNLYAINGGVLSFPTATSYTSNPCGNTIHASGLGSRVDLSGLTNLVGAGECWPSYPPTDLRALTGGRIDLSGEFNGRATLTAETNTSTLNLEKVTQFSNATLNASNGGVLNFPASCRIDWVGANAINTTGTGSKVVNRGVLSVVNEGSVLTITATDFTNYGTIEAADGASIDINGFINIASQGQLKETSSGTITISGNLLGGTQNADQYNPQGTIRLDGSGTPSAPQLVEVMSEDMGNVAAGFSRNFAYDTFALANSTYVKLVNQSVNSTGSGSEALYVNSLFVPVGTTLDLNGLHLYARTAQIAGTILGGSIVQIPDGGPIPFGVPTPGSIAIAGELDEWTFFGRGGRSVAVLVNPGNTGTPAPLSPYLAYARVQVIDINGNVLADKSSTGSGQIVSIADVLLPTDGNYRIQVRASAGHMSNTGNYLATLWDVTADVADLVLNKQVSGRIETPYSVDRWIFSAAAGQQVRFDLINAGGPEILFNLTGPGAWIGFKDAAGDSDLITLPAAGTYTLTAHSVAGSSGGIYSFRLVETTVTDLAFGTPYNGTITGSSHVQIFRLNVPLSMPLQVKLNDASVSNHNEIYAKFGMPPTRGDYQYRYTKISAPDQDLLVPMATAGTWYILLYCDYASSSSNYSLTATAAGIIVPSVTPDHHGNSADAILTLSGSGFESDTSVELVGADGLTYSASQVQLDSFTQLTAIFAAGTVPAGTYSIRVSQPDGDSATLYNAFQVTEAGSPNLVTNVVVPGNVGRHANATIYVEYANTGQVAMPAPLLVLHGTDKALMTLDQSRVLAGFWTSAKPEGFGDTIQILASGNTPGVLQPGESFRIPVYFSGLLQPWDFGDNQVEFNLGVLRADNASPIDWASLKGSMKPAAVTAEAWEALWSNFTAQVGTTWGHYVRMLDDNASYLGRLGQRVVDVGELLAFEFQQADGISPIRSLAAAVDASVTVPGLPVVFTRSFSTQITRRYALGSLGRGWSHNWDIWLSKAADGAVTITGPGGSRRVFLPDGRTTGFLSAQGRVLAYSRSKIKSEGSGLSYFSQAGDHATLSSFGGGVYTLREPNGLLYAFRSDGKLDYVEDTNGNRITTEYSNGYMVRLSHTSGQSLQIAYSAAGRISGLTDSDGRQTLFTYDASGEHLLSVQQYDGRTIAYQYSAGQGAAKEHALIGITYPGNTHQFFVYDGNGRLSRIYRDGEAESVGFAYDAAGKVTATDALGNSGKFYFDHRGLLVKTENAKGDAVHMAFDRDYNLTQVTDPAGRSYRYAYDSLGNLALSTDAMGNSTRFTYSSTFNRLTSLADAKDNRTAYGYDSQGNLQSITYPNGSTETWTYDSKGNPTAWNNRRGSAIQYRYDSAGRLTQKTFEDGSHADYVYDARGNLASAADPTGTTQFTYDANDYLTRIAYPGGQWLQFTYDEAGRRASSLDQLGHRLDYRYDAVGRLERMTNEGGSEIVRYAYDPAGRLSRKNLDNGVYTTYEYDAAGQLLHLVNLKAGGEVLSRFDYTYDSRGRRVSMGTSYGQWSYEYDDIGQLIHAVLASTDPETPSRDLTYVYDPLGNRIRSIENGISTEYTTNGMNQYTRIGDTTYTFDVDGNLTQETSPQGTTTYAYNDENRLVAVTKGTDAWQYTYDALGNRVATNEKGTVTRYVIDPIGLGNVVGEYDGSGNLMARYDHGLGLISRTQGGGSSAYYVFDAIGSTSQLTNAAGSVANTYRYDPFGISLRKSETIANLFQYVGGFGVMQEGTGMDFMRRRFYDSNTGHFSSIDPLRLPADHKYSFVGNAPSMFIDPSGLAMEDLFGVATDVAKHFGKGKVKTIAEAMDSPVVTAAKGILEPNQAKWIGGTAGAGILGGAGYVIGGYIGAGLGIITGNPVIGVAGYLALSKVGAIIGGYIGGQLGSSVGELIWPDLGTFYRDFDIPSPTPPTNSLSSVVSAISTSTDPNQKTGPSGFDTAGYITSDTLLPYRIDFENEPNATAPAQQVVVNDQLSADFDWTTFQLTEIAFGDRFITIPANTQHFETTVPMTYNDVSFDVQIEAGIQSSTGRVYAVFRSIDPNTGLPPGVNTGFLPPENGTGRGQGHVSYTVRVKSGLAKGTEIRNVALISFDNLPSIATNQVDPHDPTKGTDPGKECLNTIGATFGLNVTNAGNGRGTVSSYPAGITCSDSCSAQFFEGTAVTLTATKEGNYIFTGWSGDCTGKYSTCIVTMFGAKSVTATFVSGPQIQVTPSSLNFGYVPPGSYKDLILEAKNIGTGTLTGNATTVAPFSIVSGGTYSLGAGQIQQVVVRYTAPLQEGAQTGSIIFTGGDGFTVQVKGTNQKVGLPWLMLLLLD